MNKARRGDLRCRLPIGLVYDAADRVVLDPNLQVQESIRLLFATFERTGAGCATVKHFTQQNLLFPLRPDSGPHKGELVWQRLGLKRALTILHNPRYAGAFVWGRRRTMKLPNGRVHAIDLPRDEWIAVRLPRFPFGIRGGPRWNKSHHGAASVLPVSLQRGGCALEVLLGQGVQHPRVLRHRGIDTVDDAGEGQLQMSDLGLLPLVQSAAQRPGSAPEIRPPMGDPMRLAATAAVLTLTPTLVAQEFPAWGDLRPGPFAVGFESRWELDTSRVYDRTLSTGEPYAGGGKAPRPILVNLWYPALPPEEDAIAMTHGEYLNLTADDASLRQLSMDLAEYANGVIAEWAIGKTLDALDEWSFSQLERLLATPTASYRYAARAEGRFPMVIYHAGYGSSFEDNSVLCEYLASHGYMVVGSAFLDETGESLNIDGKAGSARDFGFLIQLMSGEPRVDWQHVGVVGHSGGAHASLEFQSQPAAAVDAVISLDTTQDYVSALDPHWRHTAFMLKGVPHEKTPLLMVAQPHAFFQAADRLVNAERYYLTFRDLEHNDYTLQGVWTAEVAALRARRDSDPGLEEREAYARAARRGFEQCTEYARIFLDAFLKNDKAARGALGTLYRDTPLAGDDPHVEYAAKGVAAPPTFDLDGSEPPTPREAIALLAVHGAGVLAEVLERVHPGHENAPVFHNRFAFGVLYDLLATHRADEAALLAPLLCRLHPDLATNFAWWAERDPPQSYPEFREYAYAAALLLDPDNETLRQKAQPSAR